VFPFFEFETEPVPTRGRGSRRKLRGPSGLEGGPEPDNVACVFIFRDSIINCRFTK